MIGGVVVESNSGIKTYIKKQSERDARIEEESIEPEKKSDQLQSPNEELANLEEMIPMPYYHQEAAVEIDVAKNPYQNEPVN